VMINSREEDKNLEKVEIKEEAKKMNQKRENATKKSLF